MINASFFAVMSTLLSITSFEVMALFSFWMVWMVVGWDFFYDFVMLCS